MSEVDLELSGFGGQKDGIYDIYVYKITIQGEREEMCREQGVHIQPAGNYRKQFKIGMFLYLIHKFTCI